MSKHTPGPWAVVRTPKGETGPTRIILAGSKDHYSGEICVLYTNPDGSTGNADLIAAAPEMLKALKHAEIEIVEYLEFLPKPHDCEKTLAAVRAAIAKAEGRL